MATFVTWAYTITSSRQAVAIKTYLPSLCSMSYVSATVSACLLSHLHFYGIQYNGHLRARACVFVSVRTKQKTCEQHNCLLKSSELFTVRQIPLNWFLCWKTKIIIIIRSRKKISRWEYTYWQYLMIIMRVWLSRNLLLLDINPDFNSWYLC